MGYNRKDYNDASYIGKDSGKHVVKVTHLEKDVNYNGDDVLKYTLQNKAKETIVERITMSEKGGYRLFKFADACQVNAPDLEPEMMLGHYLEIQVGHSAPAKEGSKYEGRTFSQVDAYSTSTIPPDKVRESDNNEEVEEIPF